MDFDWDPEKAAVNERKHRIRFQTAIEVFADHRRVDFDVTRDTDGEVRRKVVGYVRDRLVTVVYTVRSGRVG
jgi:uncharacterized DUF497 family protein